MCDPAFGLRLVRSLASSLHFNFRFAECAVPNLQPTIVIPEKSAPTQVFILERIAGKKKGEQERSR
jgi:hypothetical protein